MMPALLRDYKPGKRLAAQSRRKALANGHWLKTFRPVPSDLVDDNPLVREGPNYWSECRFCNKFVILNFDDPGRYEAFGSALNDPCPATKT